MSHRVARLRLILLIGGLAVGFVLGNALRTVINLR